MVPPQIWAGDYPLGARVWTLQENTPDFTRIDEGISGKALTGATRSQDPTTKNILMPLFLELFLSQ
jgi:hypothetical protein